MAGSAHPTQSWTAPWSSASSGTTTYMAKEEPRESPESVIHVPLSHLYPQLFSGPTNLSADVPDSIFAMSPVNRMISRHWSLDGSWLICRDASKPPPPQKPTTCFKYAPTFGPFLAQLFPVRACSQPLLTA